MSKLILCLAFGLLMVSPLAVHAQDDNPFADLDPDAIFADGVEIIETFPIVNFDNDARQIHFFDSDSLTWNSFAYPPDVDQFERYSRRSDSTYLLFEPS